MNAHALYFEMSSKHGFADGAAVPVYAEEARTVLIAALRSALPVTCDREPYAFDRDGMHNWCLLLWRRKTDPAHPVLCPCPDCDLHAPAEALEILTQLDEEKLLDSLIAVTISLADEYLAAIASWAARPGIASTAEQL